MTTSEKSAATRPIPAGPAEQPTEVALVLADLVRKITVAAADDLQRLLGFSVGLPEAGMLRAARLGLLRELIQQRTGEIPGTEDYERLRARKEAADNEWPTASTLSNAYGGWVAAVRAAMRLDAEGSASKLSTST